MTIVNKHGINWYVPSGKFQYMPLEDFAIEDAVIGWIKNRFQYGEQFIDIGANVGLYSMKLANNFKEIISVEPNPVNAYILRKNIELNHLKNVSVLEVAAWNRPEVLFFNQMVPDSLAAQARVRAFVEDKTVSRPFNVFGVPLDDYDLSPTLIKMDIEGGEFDAIYGLENTMNKHKPTVIVEVHQFLPDGKTVEEFIATVSSFNYIFKGFFGGWDGETVKLRYCLFEAAV